MPGVTIGRVGLEPLSEDDGEMADGHKEELMARDMDLDTISEVRNTWQFFRDRRPDGYADLVRP